METIVRANCIDIEEANCFENGHKGRGRERMDHHERTHAFDCDQMHHMQSSRHEADIFAALGNMGRQLGPSIGSRDDWKMAKKKGMRKRQSARQGKLMHRCSDEAYISDRALVNCFACRSGSH